MAQEVNPARPALESAQAYAANARAIAEDESSSPDRALQWAVRGGAGKVQRAHLDAAGAYAAVATAEALERIAEALYPAGITVTEVLEAHLAVLERIAAALERLEGSPDA